MARAAETAKIIASTVGVAPQLWVETHEVGGLFEKTNSGSVAAAAGKSDAAFKGVPGMSRAAMQAFVPGIVIPATAAINEHGWWHSVRKETDPEADVRVARVLAALRARAAALGAAAGIIAEPEPMPSPSLVEAAAEAAASAGTASAGAGSGASASAAVHTSLPAPAAFDVPLPLSETAVAAHAHAAAPAPSSNAVRSGFARHDEPQRAAAPAPDTATGAGDGKPRIRRQGVMPAAGGATIIMVTHGDFLDTLLRHIVLSHSGGVGGSPPLQFCHNNCGISVVDFFPDAGTRIVRLNDVRHLIAAGVPSAAAPSEGGDSSGGDALTFGDASMAAVVRAAAAAALTTPLVTGAVLG